jgi:ABC-type Mn2+/Zn2+ transport system ATPase subunit
MDVLVAFDEAAFSYGGELVLEGVTLRVDRGALLGLVGPSGAGKTTLLRAVLRQVKPVRGEVRLGRRTRVGYVPQLETIDWHFPITVAELVHQGRATESGPWPWPRKRDRQETAELLDRLGIAHLASRHIRALSGGQQQRAFLARALIRRPELLLLDEPTAGVDVRTRREVLDLLRSLNADGIAIVLTTHDLNAVAAGLPRIVCLNRRVVSIGPPEVVLTPEVLRATFGSEMLVFRHDGSLLTVDAPDHAQEHAHHVHVHDEHTGEPEQIVAGPGQ